MTAALEASHLGRRFGRQWALEDCSFRLARGRVAALVGPNGAGKTTLLNLAVGLLRPTTGEVRVAGFPAAVDDPAVLARVGFVAQNTPLYGAFTATELVRMGRALNASFDAAMALRRWDELGIPVDRKVADLSGGQRAQVALALALAKRPEVLLLDEPLASLDPLARRELLQTLMASVADTGSTVVLSSHLLADLERVCDHLLVLSGGHVQLAGDTDDLLAAHRLVRGPRRLAAHLPREWTVVDDRSTAREASLLVRCGPPGRSGRAAPVAGVGGPFVDPAYEAVAPTLEELVLAYLANPVVAALPGPEPFGGAEHHFEEVAR